MGHVYKAVDTRLGRMVALKGHPHKDSPARARDSSKLRKEARALAAIEHPRIGAVHDVCQSDDVEFIVMEAVDGRTLAAELSSRERFTRDDLLTAAGQLADGLSAAHQRGIVHRDLKPANIMVTPLGLKILDFGLARFLTGRAAARTDVTTGLSVSSHETIRGTLQYLAPEAVEGRTIDERADVFALGAILDEMATGRPAFCADTPQAALAAILTLDVPSLVAVRPDLPRAFAEVVAQCLRKAPEHRYKTAREVQVALAGIRPTRRSRQAVGQPPLNCESGPEQSGERRVRLPSCHSSISLAEQATTIWRTGLPKH